LESFRKFEKGVDGEEKDDRVVTDLDDGVGNFKWFFESFTYKTNERGLEPPMSLKLIWVVFIMYSSTNSLNKTVGKLKINSNFYRDVYLNSEHWKGLRKEKLSDSPVCERCGSSIYLEIHHKSYKGLYDVSVNDLETLCRICHEKEHALKKKSRFDRRRKNKKDVGIDKRRSQYYDFYTEYFTRVIQQARNSNYLFFYLLLKKMTLWFERDKDFLSRLKNEREFSTFVSIRY
jgi:hypothetical protein